MAPPNARVIKAFRAMKDLGIAEEVTKPVLKNLLKVYDKNWELIEEENYRALVDAIFDTQDSEVKYLSPLSLTHTRYIFKFQDVNFVFLSRLEKLFIKIYFLFTLPITF